MRFVNVNTTRVGVEYIPPHTLLKYTTYTVSGYLFGPRLFAFFGIV